MNVRRIFLDMDGVLADFDAALAAKFGADVARIANNDRNYKWLIEGDAEVSVKRSEFWRRLSDDNTAVSFWAELPPLPWAKQLVETCQRIAPTAILTSGPDEAPVSAQGKVLWALEHFRGVRLFPMYNKVKGSLGKGFMAAPGNVLIDDTWKACEDFAGAGGTALHFPTLRREDQDMGGQEFVDRLEAELAGEASVLTHNRRGA